MSVYRLYLNRKPVNVTPFDTLQDAIEYVEHHYLADKIAAFQDVGFMSDTPMSRDERQSWSYTDYETGESPEVIYTITQAKS
jgi:hypothetical protein